MMEHRLRVQQPYLVHMDQRIERARQAMERPWYPQLLAVTAEYLSGLLVALQQVTEDAISDAVEQYCHGSVFPGPADAGAAWPAAFDRQLSSALRRDEGEEREALGPVQWLVGQALMDAFVRRGQGAADVWIVAHLVSAVDVRIFAFATAFEALDASARQFVVEAVGILALRERDHAADHLSPGRRAMLPEALSAWAEETDFGAVWDTRAWIGMDMYSDELGFLGVLCAQRPAELLPAVESIAIPPLVESVLRHPAITMDMDRLLESLEHAPSLLDPQTGLWNHNLAAAYLLELAFEHVTQLGTPDRSYEQRPHAQPEELHALVGHIVARTLGRPDGTALLQRWLRRLVGQVGHHPNDERLSNVLDATLDAFAGAPRAAVDAFLAKRAPDVSGGLAPQMTEADAEVKYQNLLVSILLRERQTQAGIPHTATALRAVFGDLLRTGRQPFRVSYNERAVSWRHRVFATLYVSEPEPVVTWFDDFNAHAAELRASLHWSYMDDRTLSSPGTFLAGVGIALLDQCHMADEAALRVHVLPGWKVVFDASMPFFIHWGLGESEWRSVCNALFARLPAYAAATELAQGVTLARSALHLLGGDETLFVTAVANLHSNGMTFAQLAGDSAATMTMLDRIASYLRWEAQTGNRNLSDGVVRYWATNFPADAGMTPTA